MKEKIIKQDMETYIKLLISEYKQHQNELHEIMENNLKNDCDAYQVKNRTWKKDGFKTIINLYELVKTEKGQNVLGEILCDWSASDYSKILLGYKALLLTTDLNSTIKVIEQISNDDGVKRTLIERDIIRIARAEEIEYTGKKNYEKELPSEEDINANRYKKEESNIEIDM